MGIAELRATGMHRLELYGASLQREIGKYAFLPGVLELEGDVLDLLQAPDTPGLASKVNTYLEQLNDRAGPTGCHWVGVAGGTSSRAGSPASSRTSRARKP